MAVVTFFSCNKETDPTDEVKNDTKELIVTAEASEIGYDYAILCGYANLSEGMTGVTFGVIVSEDENPTVDNGWICQAIELGENNKYHCEIGKLWIGTKYYYKAYLKEGDYYRTGSKTLSFTTKDLKKEQTAVDLGLSVKWGSCNIGASSPVEYGDYYAWGEIEPKEDYSWDSYKWGRRTKMTKYNSQDKKTILEQADDVAHLKLGGKWRMPTIYEFDELLTKCTFWIMKKNGKWAYLVEGPSGNVIVLPAAGGRNGSSLSAAGSFGYYWSASLNEDVSDFAMFVSFNSEGVYIRDYSRYEGHSVRPVSE